MLRKLYKKLIISFFKIYYGKLYINNNIYKNKIKKFFNKNIKFYELKNARVYTNTNDVAYIINNKIIKGPSLQIRNKGLNSKIHNNVCLKTGTPNFYRYYPVRIFSLLSGVDANNNYYHWFFDSLSRIFIYKKFYKIKKNDFFLVHNLKHDFQIQSLKLFGIKNLINAYKINHIKATKILAINFIREFNFSSQKWLINSFRNIFLKKKKLRRYKKIFINRSGSGSLIRDIYNKNEVLNFLKSKGFLIIDSSKLKFNDEIKLFSEAKFIIGVYGAGLTNIIFCNKKTRIIELRPSKVNDNLYRNMAINAGLKYSCIYGKIIQKADTNRSFDGLFHINMSDLKKTLKI